MRLVPDMTAADTLAKLKAHLAKHGFADIEVNMSGGYDPKQNRPDSKFIQDPACDLSQARDSIRSYGRAPRAHGRAMCSPIAPLSLPAGHFGLGHGTGAHAPDEYYLIESTNPKVQGLDGAVASFVEYLYALA